MPVHLLQHLVPALLLKHELMFVRRKRVARGRFVRLAEFAQRGVHVVLVDHDAGLGAAGFGAQLAAQPVEVEFAILEVRVGLQLVPRRC